MAYRAGVAKRVSSVANERPNTIVAAMPPNTMSNSSGMLPNTVVAAAMSTGRVRETVASTIAVDGGTPARLCRLTSSSNTMMFFYYHTQQSEPSGNTEETELETRDEHADNYAYD